MTHEAVGWLIKGQAAEHFEHRAFEVVAEETGVIVVQCSCNARLTLQVPTHVVTEPAHAPVVHRHPKKGTGHDVP